MEILLNTNVLYFHFFKVGKPIEYKPPECIKWRQTGGCKPEGSHEPGNDKECSALIQGKASGYCECKDGRKTLQKRCKDDVSITCHDACTNGIKLLV